MKTIPPAALMKSTAPKTLPNIKRTQMPYVPDLRNEKVFWQPKLDGIWEILDVPNHDPHDSTMAQCEAEAAAKCVAIVHIEDMLKNMLQGPHLRSEYYKMQFHLLLFLLMKGGEQSNVHLVEAEELYETVLEEYPSQDESAIKEVGERIRDARRSIDPVEESKESKEVAEEDIQMGE
jgi:hypothetical protein